MIHPVHPEYGERFECFRCGVKFYDMGKAEKVCPSCGTDQADCPSPEEKLFASRYREEVVPDDDFVDVEPAEAAEEIDDVDVEESEGIEGSDSFDELEGEEDEE